MMMTQPSMPAGLTDLCARHLSTAAGASQRRHIMVTDPNWVHSDGGWRPTATGLSQQLTHSIAALASAAAAPPPRP